MEQARGRCTYPGEYSAETPQSNHQHHSIAPPPKKQIKTTPKQPKVNGTMTVKVKISNLGDTDGLVGRVVIFITVVEDAAFLRYSYRDCSDPSDPFFDRSIYSLNTTDLVIKAGKSKTVKIADVPVPARVGWSGLVVVPDANCANEAARGMVFPPLPYNAFEVVAL
ncbi:hypothetical protein Rsub_05044 [Raphidocelis subcapitata]|uniref:Uncharacterized protein n=1 Tax=Raphidocelis subcapitata TaxID=307507 RepID=A0A2V0P6F8_9CHLO|nr:hypothetical protein Rsub_05044 [Raphidocelis subcapitata]|eukprot:GBF92675.1 hypothetical protein Rsub_05044 [Raphidocelis subcapitata]